MTVNNQRENAENYFNSERSVEDALNILCTSYADLESKFGEDALYILRDAEDVVMDENPEEWEDGVIVNGRKYRTEGCENSEWEEA